MGADGHVQIFDLEKMTNEYDQEIVDSFFKHFSSSTMYRQDLNGREYLTRYFGDNIQFSDMYDIVRDAYDPKTHTFNKDYWSYSDFEAEYFLKLSRPIRKQFYEIINFLETQCRLTTWEVWT